MLDFLTISLIILLAVISPGPDFAIVSRNALRYSQKIGLFTAMGVSCGALFHGSYCILGFAIVISKSLLAFNIIKYVGAAYLIYLGIKGLLEKQTSSNQVTIEKFVKEISAAQAFRQGILCNVLNPKTILFFLALFTMMIKPSTSLATQAGYGIEISIIHFSWFSLVALFFSHPKVKLFLGKFFHYITKAFGGLLVIFGLKIATISQH